MASISRADIEALIEDEYSTALLNVAGQQSTVLSTFPTVSMGTKAADLPALATLPEASFVGETDETRTKPTTKFTFEKKRLVAAEIATIIKLNEEDLEDANENLLEHAATLGGTAIGRTLDQAVLFGINKPAVWTSNSLFDEAVAAGAVFSPADAAGKDDLIGSFFQAAEYIDDSDATPNAFIARNGLKYRLANLRDAQGQPIYIPSLSNTPGAVDSVGGLDAHWNTNGAWDKTKATALVADTNQVLIGVRSDISVKFLDQATVDGKSLAENDQVALRFRARYAYTLANVINYEGGRKAAVSAVVPAAAGGE